MANPYEDSRKQMHPGIAASVPNTPDAMAILRGDNIVPYTFGGVVTKLVEQGVVPSGSMDEVRLGVSYLLDLDLERVDTLMQHSTTLSNHTTNELMYQEERRADTAERKANKANWQNYLVERAFAALGDPQIDQIYPLIAEQQARVERVMDESEQASILKQRFVEHKFEIEMKRLAELESSRFAIPLGSFLAILRDDPHIRRGFADPGDKDNLYGGLARELEYMRGIYLPELSEWESSDDDEEAPNPTEEDQALLDNTWLAEADVARLGLNIAEAYECTEGWHGRQRLPRMLAQILLIRDEQREEFKNAFPDAHAHPDES